MQKIITIDLKNKNHEWLIILAENLVFYFENNFIFKNLIISKN